MSPLSRRDLTRRDFLRAGGLVVLGATAAACSKSSPTPATPKTLDEVIAGRGQDLEFITVGTELLPGVPERFTFALGDPKTRTPIPNMSGRLWIARERTSDALGPFPVVYHGDGLGDRGVYQTNLTFPEAGTWLAFAEATPVGAGKPRVGGAQVQVGVQTAMPKPGDKAVVVATPTERDGAGVNPICTRKPPCDLHRISLDQAVLTDKPTVLVIATPAFCQSRICGPEVDIVQDVSREFAERANFIHLEVYRDDKPDTITKQILAPAAAAWKLDQEPVIYYIDRKGVIQTRHLGPVDRADVRLAARKLVG